LPPQRITMNELSGIWTRAAVFGVLCVLSLLVVSVTASAEVVEIRPALIKHGDSIGIEYHSGTELIGRSTEAAPAGVELLLPEAAPATVTFRTKTEREGASNLARPRLGH
jgi:hypothetical protein